MIKLEKITIKEFRGIRDLSLKLNQDNFVICGPNGTGKSGIVDAIEFVLTGNISRLSGAGTGGITIRDHGPHVDSRHNPEKAYVTLELTIPSISKAATIHRTVKNAGKPTITPNDADVLSALSSIADHPEFVLSRRELIRYVLSEPGKRSQEVQALLRLDEIEALRKTLQKISNAEAKTLPLYSTSKKTSGEELMRAMGIGKLSSTDVLAAANGKRLILSLPSLTTFDVTTSLKEGLSTMKTGDSRSVVAKATMLSDLTAAKEQLNLINSKEFKNLCTEATTAINALEKLSIDENSETKESLYQNALKLFDDQFCPVCDTEWEPEEFNSLVNKKLKQLTLFSSAKAEAIKSLESIAQPIEKAFGTLTLLIKAASQLSSKIETPQIASYINYNRSQIQTFRKLFPLDATISAVANAQEVSIELLKEISKIEKGVDSIPEPTQQDAARDYLVIAQERLEQHRQTSQQLKKAEEKSKLAKEVYNIYNDSINVELEKIYKNVEESFIEMYREINDDEKKFTAQLTPSAGKLGFDVDFYGRGYFPPGAYHSEGHQDGMGLCLYLALMNHLLKGNFQFAVLDDVLMSVDTGHRREVTKMLKSRFPNVQFIMTTHDDIWLRTMKTVGLVSGKNFAHFRKWSVDLGPTEWDNRDVWREIEDYLAKNDVRAAAGLLRHYLEYISQEICHVLRAQVYFRGDAQFELGDVLPNAMSAFSKALKKGKDVAVSWGNKADETKIIEMEEAFSKAYQATEAEKWQINPSVHYNAWANFTAKDFTPVVAAYKTLLELLECSVCNGMFYLLPAKGESHILRCDCMNLNINLVKKPKGTGSANNNCQVA